MTEYVSGVGPLFGPDFVLVTVNDETGRPVSLQVYPDAHNPELKANGLPTQYYFQPQRVYLARKQTAPEEFDFGMTVFAGLASDETTIGVGTLPTHGGFAEVGGGFCTFSTTFAIPDGVLQAATQKIMMLDHPPVTGRLETYFNYQSGMPAPRLGIVPIPENTVTLEVPDLAKAADGSQVPMYIGGVTQTKGSVEAHGYTSFLVTCNQFAAGAIAGSLKAGKSPFVIRNALKELFYVNAVTATVVVDVDKVYSSFSAAVSAGGFLGIDSFTASYAYSRCVTEGGITTHMTQNGAVLDEPLRKWVESEVEAMKKMAMELVKAEIFDWDPSKADARATTDRGWFSEVFGGYGVALKSSYEKRSITLDQTLVLDLTISVEHTVSGDLNDLGKAAQADPDLYVAMVDIGEPFQKIQLVSCCETFDKAVDGTISPESPVRSVQLQASYPDRSSPVNPDGSVNLHTQAEGFHYTVAQVDQTAATMPAIWTRDNPHDLVNIAWLRLFQDAPGWPADQVRVTTTLVYDDDDPRVNFSPALSPDGVRVQYVETVTGGASTITTARVGQVEVNPVLEIDLPKNVIVTFTPTIGGDTYPALRITGKNQADLRWKVFTDKYDEATEFTYTLDVVVTGPHFTDPPIRWSTPAPVAVGVPEGRMKLAGALSVPLPPPPSGKEEKINEYIVAASE